MWIRIPHIKAYTKGGRDYAYCRLTGTRLKKPFKLQDGTLYGSPELVAEVAAIRSSIPSSGTIAAMFADYKEHDVSVKGRKAFCHLSARTQADYNKDLGALLGAKIDGRNIGQISPSAIGVDEARAIRDAWNTKHGAVVAARMMAACSVLWGYGLEYGLTTENPWRAIKKPQKVSGKPRANPPWFAWEVLAAVETAPFEGLARFYVLACLGVRPQQIPTLPISKLRGFASSKTKQEHLLTIPDVFASLFADAGNTILASTGPDGLPWMNYNQVSREFIKHRAELVRQGAMRPECTLKGLNHTMGAASADRGFTDAQMEAAMARTRETVSRYSDRGNRQKMADEVFAGLSEWLLSTKEGDVSTGRHG